MTEGETLYQALVNHVGADRILRKGGKECYVTCPECGRSWRHEKFSFSMRGAHCFVCGYSATLEALAKRLGLAEGRAYEPVAAREEPSRPKRWQRDPGRYLRQFLEAPDRLDAWQSYKPLSIDTIARWRLGVGIQPGVPCQHRRLIVPVFSGGELVNFRGRSFCCDCAKWMTSGRGPVLFGLDRVAEGDVVYWVENNVDAILVSQETPYKGVSSTHGASAWRDLIEPLAAKRPGLVVVALDNDLAGQPNAETLRALAAEWRRKNPKAKRTPRPNGPQIATELARLKVPVTLWEWPKGTPPHADMGWLLGQGLESAA